MTLRMVFLVTAHLAIAAIVARADGPLLRTDYDNWFDGNAQQLCMGKKSEGGGMSGLTDGQVTVSGADTLGIDMKFDVDCGRPENDYQNATVKSCIYPSSNLPYGELVLKAHASRRESAERVINMDWSGNAFDIRVYCTKKGAASAQKVEEEDPMRGIGPIQSVEELCIVNRGDDVRWGVYERSSRQVISVTYKMKCNDTKVTQEVASCTVVNAIWTLKAGPGAVRDFWYQGQADTRPQQYTHSCSKTKGAVIVKSGVHGNTIASNNQRLPSQHKGQTSTGQAQEKPTGSLFHRLDK